MSSNRGRRAAQAASSNETPMAINQPASRGLVATNWSFFDDPAAAAAHNLAMTMAITGANRDDVLGGIITMFDLDDPNAAVVSNWIRPGDSNQPLPAASTSTGQAAPGVVFVIWEWIDRTNNIRSTNDKVPFSVASRLPGTRAVRRRNDGVWPTPQDLKVGDLVITPEGFVNDDQFEAYDNWVSRHTPR